MIEEILDEAEEIYYHTLESKVTKEEIRELINREELNKAEVVKLLLHAENELLEPMAWKARKLTDMYFGKTIVLYTPLYISNFCNSGCIYCGYSVFKKSLKREKLSLPEIQAELSTLKEKGFDSVLILTGEDRVNSPVEYIAEAVKMAAAMFSEVLIEVYALTSEEYASLMKNGLTGVTIYQETYNRDLYNKLHIFGEKKDYTFRLKAPERAITQGAKQINIGALLGLDDPVRDMFMTLVHADYLMRRYPHVEVSVSYPRLRPAGTRFRGFHQVGDATFVKFILATRLFLPRVGINISTRESAFMRDNLIGLGVTKMSAGSRTTVGGYSYQKDSSGQFEVDDTRDVPSVIEAIRARGYRPEFINWVRGLV